MAFVLVAPVAPPRMRGLNACSQSFAELLRFHYETFTPEGLYRGDYGYRGIFIKEIWAQMGASEHKGILGHERFGHV